MKFEEVVGQKKLLKQLRKIVDDDRLPHALFLKGKNGYGSLPLALSLSAYILTSVEERTDLNSSNSYTKAIKYLHPDLHFAFPVVKHGDKKRAETTSRDFIKEWRNALTGNSYLSVSEWLISINSTNSAGDINVAECNQILANLSLKPFESEYKIQIIWMPEYLGNNGNKLLKLIEEPPENSVFIFIGESTDSVLNTITSRCQIINIPRIADNEIENYLMLKHEIAPDAAQKISFLADGDYNSALSLLSMNSTISLEFMLQWLAACDSYNALAVRDWVNLFIDLGKEERKGSLIYFLKVLRETIHYKILGDRINKLDEEERNLVQKNVTLNKLTVGHIGEISDVVNNIYVLLERNANPRILLFQSSLEIGQIIKKSTLATEV